MKIIEIREGHAVSLQEYLKKHTHTHRHTHTQIVTPNCKQNKVDVMLANITARTVEAFITDRTAPIKLGQTQKQNTPLERANQY